MVWEKFEERKMATKEPTVALTASGLLFCNRICFEKYLSNSQYAVLYYNQEEKLIGIKPVNKPERSSYHIIKNKTNGGCTVSAIALCKQYGIDCEKQKGRRNARWDSKRQMVVVNLKEKI